MLVLNRKAGEQILLGNDVVLTVLALQGRRVRIGIEAPFEVPIRRSELMATHPLNSVGSIEVPASSSFVGNDHQPLIPT